VLTLIREDELFELDVTIAQKGYGWGVWQRQNGTQVPFGFWGQL
jgi:hypothetical protein